MKPTREQVLAEPPGRQMDAWVAEFCLGWTRRPNCTRPLWLSVWDVPGEHWRRLYRWSTDMRYAGHLAEEMVAAGKIRAYQLGRDAYGVMWANYRTGDGWPTYGGTKGDDLAHALCRALLLAVLA